MGPPRCAEDNTEDVDQSTFWVNGFHFDAHRIGWTVAGACAVITVIITIFSVLGHARHYHVRAEQRQIIRILYMPPVFAIISFFSYRFFREYTYYSLVESVYEAFVISAFLMLVVQYVAATSSTRTAEGALMRKDKTRLPIPLCCWRYRPSKPYFMYTLKWSVLQYVIIKPACSVAGIVTQYYGLLCEGKWSPHYAAVYLSSVDFVSISVALMGLIVFYALTKDELAGRRPLAKFLCIKLIVMMTFYQGFVFSALQSHGIIKATTYWTSTNIADGLNALTTCCEMVLFAIFMWWAYPSSEYLDKGTGTTNIFRPLWDSINFIDFVYEIWTSLVFFFDYALGKPHTRSNKSRGSVDFATAFRLYPQPSGSSRSAVGMTRLNKTSAQEPFLDQNGHGPSQDGSLATTEPKPRPAPEMVEWGRAV